MKRRLIALCAVVLLLAGCQQQALYSNLTEQEANEIVALMYASGMPASKVAEKGGLYRVDTSRDAFAGAMALLQAYGLPRERFESLGEVFAREGFVSSPLEERARLNHALSQEIAHSISYIDGVVMARVHLAVPEREPLADAPAQSSASVFVKHRAEIDLSDSVGKIKALVVDGVENLPYENVTVSLFPAADFQREALTAPIVAPGAVNKAGLADGRLLAVLIAGAMVIAGLTTVIVNRRGR